MPAPAQTSAQQLRAALYARVSTDDQAREGYSIPAQLKRLNAFCKAKGWSITGEFVDDGFSGRDADRPRYKDMMARKDDWDVLLVMKMDRIHRNSRNFALMMDDLNRWSKQFSSMQEKFDTTSAMGRFVMDIVQRIAQLESEQTGERVKVGMTQKAMTASGHLGSGHPYGYVITDGRLVTVPHEAGVVPFIYQAYMSGRTLAEIAGSLNSAGIASKKGGSWSKQAVSNVLTNPLYCGYIRWDGRLVHLEHDVLVSIAAFDMVQGMMEQRRRNASGRMHDRVGAEA